MTASKFLDGILELFNLNQDNSELLDYLLKNKMLHSSFEQRYIINLVDFGFVVTKLIHKDNNWVGFYLTATDGTPYKAEVVFNEKWYLKSFLLQCQGCFGDDKECGVCGGSGWGVL